MSQILLDLYKTGFLDKNEIAVFGNAVGSIRFSKYKDDGTLLEDNGIKDVKNKHDNIVEKNQKK